MISEVSDLTDSMLEQAADPEFAEEMEEEN